MPVPAYPPELCTHPSFDDDGLCRACGEIVALGVPKAFAAFNARMFADDDVDRTSPGPALCQSCVRARKAVCTIVDVLAPCICCGEPTYGRNFER